MRLGLKSIGEWLDYCNSGKKPDDIPVQPRKVYLETGWAGWGDWLGTTNRRRWLAAFQESAQLSCVVSVSKSRAEWREYSKSGKRPVDIPANPNAVYAEWAGIGDWLGTDTVPSYLRQYRSFKEARAFVHRLGLKSEHEWRKYKSAGKKPTDIPAGPDRVYAKDGWSGWGDWLGTGRRRGGWQPFKKARNFVRRLGLKSSSEWTAYCKSGRKPVDIPTIPSQTYAGAGRCGGRPWRPPRRRRPCAAWAPAGRDRPAACRSPPCRRRARPRCAASRW